FPGSMQLVQGPPGTGKTTSIVETVRQLVARDPNVRILMTSHANTAVDNAQERLQGLDSLRMVRIAEPEKVDPKFRPSIVEADDPRVRTAHVVFGTVNRIALACKEAEMFDWLILDEANKVRFTETLPLLRSPLPWPFNRNLTWLTIRGREKKGGSGSISNRAEIEAVGRVVRHLQRLNLEQLRVAVIAMYQDQVTQLRRELRMVALPGLA